MSAKILVTGATGTVGRSAVKELARRGIDFRVFTRDAAKELQRGPDVPQGDFDANDRSDLRKQSRAWRRDGAGPRYACTTTQPQ